MSEDVQVIEWAVDSEGVYLCSECWDDEVRLWWPRVDADDGPMVCEGCFRYVDDEPEWLALARARAAAQGLADALKDMVDVHMGGKCRADHNGVCQEHYLDSMLTCRVAVAREALQKWEPQ